MIGHSEKSREQLTAGDKAACRIYREENENEERGNSEDYLLLLMITVAEKIRYGYGIAGYDGIAAESL